jgi:hypothetical protein
MELGEGQIKPNHVVLNKEPNFRRIVVKSNGSITYSGVESLAGVYVVSIKIVLKNFNYFQIKILTHDNSNLPVGFVFDRHPSNKTPSLLPDSFGFFPSKHAIYTDSLKGKKINIDIKKMI